MSVYAGVFLYAQGRRSDAAGTEVHCAGDFALPCTSQRSASRAGGAASKVFLIISIICIDSVAPNR